MTSIDIIGDVHGHAEALKRLLKFMGYSPRGGAYASRGRRVVFLGDLIDCGPDNIEVVAIVKAMVEAGSAIALLGNHEFNAICFHNVGDDGHFRRKRTNENIIQHLGFLQEYFALNDGGDTLFETIEWFKTLPLHYEDDNLRAVHACWDFRAIENLKHGSGSNHALLPATLKKAMYSHTDENVAVSTLINGAEVALPSGEVYRDISGKCRRARRVKWWQTGPYRPEANGELKSSREPAKGKNENKQVSVSEDGEKPVFFGHYRLTGKPILLSPNLCCLDYGVDERGGKLCAYRWDGEAQLDARKLTFVETNAK